MPLNFSGVSEIIISLFVLALLEIVLGIDNLVFISLISNRAEPHLQKMVRRIGLMVAWVGRLLLLALITFVIHHRIVLFEAFKHTFTLRDLILFLGGIYLLISATREIHHSLENGEESHLPKKKHLSFIHIMAQIFVIDLVFSLDSLITAVALTPHYWVMATAITIAIIVMVFMSEPINKLITTHPTIKMLALSFLLLIGTLLTADALHFHIPRGYVYFAICFSLFVETLNIMSRKKSPTKTAD